MNICGEISKLNFNNLLNKSKMKEQFNNTEEDINKVQLINYNDVKLNIYKNLYNQKNNNLENENKDLNNVLIELIFIVIYDLYKSKEL